MREPTVETLVRRMDLAERENRRVRRVGLVALAGLVAMVLMGQATPNPRLIKTTQIEAERFVLSDSRGRVLGGLEIRDDGTPMLFLDRPGGRKGAPGFMVAVKDDVMSLNLFAKETKNQVAIGPDKLVLKGKNGEVRIVLLSHAKGIPLLALQDKDENQRVMLLVTPDGAPYLAFRTKDGKVFWSAP
jgi:hypothetical protein